MSEQVASVLARNGQFELECRGPIFVKGKGRLTTYLVITPFDNIENDQESEELEMELDEEEELNPPPATCANAEGEAEELCSDRNT